MLKIQIIKAGLHSGIQDAGRTGMAFYGIPRAGFMDKESAVTANMLVGNKKKSPCIEMIHTGMKLYFYADATIAITGADMQPMLNGVPCPMYETINVSGGSILKMSSCRSGMISYLAVEGKWSLPKVMGSVSTYAPAGIGGLDGGLLKNGDSINIQNRRATQISMKWLDRPDYNVIHRIEILKGPEWNMLSNASDQFPMKVSKSSTGNRMGTELLSDALGINVPDDFKSQAVIPGMIQCTPGGKLIVILQDGQTTGGYPRIGMIAGKELGLFNQIKVGHTFTLTLKS